MRNSITLLAIIFIITMNSSNAQTKKELKKQEKIEKYKAMKALVENAKLSFEANAAFTQSGGRIDLIGNPNELVLNGELSEADMPYFGIVQVSSLNSDNGINFYNVVPFENNQCLINDVTVMVTDAQASFGLKYNLSTQMVVLYELSSLNTVVLQDGSRYNLWSGPEVGSIDLSQNPIEVEGCGAIRPGLREQIIAALNSMM